MYQENLIVIIQSLKNTDCLFSSYFFSISKFAFQVWWFILSTWLDLESPWQHTSGCVFEHVSREVLLRAKDLLWALAATPHELESWTEWEGECAACLSRRPNCLRCVQTCHTPAARPPHHGTLDLHTVSPNTSFLPSLRFFSGIWSPQQEKYCRLWPRSVI